MMMMMMMMMMRWKICLLLREEMTDEGKTEFMVQGPERMK